jgi:hypothetical protein
VPEVPALRRLRQEDLQFEASLDYLVSGKLKEKKIIHVFFMSFENCKTLGISQL